MEYLKVPRMVVAPVLVALLLLPLVSVTLHVEAYGREEYRENADWQPQDGAYYSSMVYLAKKGFERKPKVTTEPPKILVNTPLLTGAKEGETPFAANIKVTKDVEIPFEHEPTIAANPTDPQNLVVAAHQEGYKELAVNIGIYYSSDGGDTWNGPVLAEPHNATYDWFLSDPALTADPQGNFYLAYLSIGYRPLGYGYPTVFASSIMVGVSEDGGKTWEFVPAVTPDYVNVSELMAMGFYPDTILLDKEYIAAGPSKNNANTTLVVSYTEFLEGVDYTRYEYITNITIRVSVSTDGGKTWSRPVAVSPTYMISSSQAEIRVAQGSNPAVAPDGTIYVAYYDSGDDGWLKGEAMIMVVKSEDGGKTWSKPVVAAVLPNEVDYYYTALGVPFFRWWSSMFPVIDVGPDGTVYIVYAADANASDSDPSDIFLVYSSDGGETWSEPVRVNDDAGDAAQFFPWIDVSPDGVAHIAWGDTRLAPRGLGYDVFYASFANGTVSPNYRVSDYTTSMLYTGGFIGDYFNLAATSENVHVVWTDGRRYLSVLDTPVPVYVYGNLDIFTAKIGSRPVPSVQPANITLSAGQGAFIKLSCEGLPKYSPFIVLLNGTVVDGVSVLVSSDSEGRATVKTMFPSLEEGVYMLQLANIITGETYVETFISTVDYTARQMSGLEDRVGAVEATLASLGENVTALQRAAGSLSEDLKRVEATQSALQERVATIEEGVSALREQQKAQGQEIADIKSSMSTLAGKVDSISSKLNSLSSTVKTISSSLEDLAGNVAKAVNNAAEASSKAQNTIYLSAASVALMVAVLATLFARKAG